MEISEDIVTWLPACLLQGYFYALVSGSPERLGVPHKVTQLEEDVVVLCGRLEQTACHWGRINLGNDGKCFPSILQFSLVGPLN